MKRYFNYIFNNIKAHNTHINDYGITPNACINVIIMYSLLKIISREFGRVVEENLSWILHIYRTVISILTVP